MTETAHAPADELTVTEPVTGPAGGDGATTTSSRIVQRTILRPDQELDIRPLYVGGVSSFSAGESTTRQSGSSEDAASEESSSAPGGSAAMGMGGFGSISQTVGAVVAPERRLTFGTYFNAFPASYWRRWTSFDSVRLSMRLSGHGTVIVYRSTAKGHVQRADSAVIESSSTQTVDFELPLKPFIDGGWYWFDLEAADKSLTLESAVWAFETDKTTSGKVTIGITTFNRPEFCVDQLVQLSQQAGCPRRHRRDLAVDQGTQKVSDHELYDAASASLGDKLRLIEQGNLGGSGGFSRAMDEATTKGDADYVLLLDDDVVCEPEGILRAVAFRRSRQASDSGRRTDVQPL
ncbi:MAG: glycosyltransferase [Nocardioidaceae bacterium]